MAIPAGQGFFLTVLIFHKHGNLFANRFLGALILLYSVFLVHLFFGDLGYPDLYYRLAPLIIGLAFAMIPLHYLYAKYLVENVTSFRREDLLHFLPFLLWEGIWLVALLLFREARWLWTFTIGSSETATNFVLFNWLILLHAGGYLYQTVVVRRRYRRRIENVFSTIDRIKMDWLRYLTYLTLALVGIFLLENVLNLFGTTISGTFALSSLLVAVYVYTIGYLGLFKSEVFTLPQVASTMRHLPEMRFRAEASSPDAGEGKYEKLGLTREKAGEYRQRLEELMRREHPYIESDLTLDMLADRLNITPHNLSEVINTQLQQSFFDFGHSPDDICRSPILYF